MALYSDYYYFKHALTKHVTGHKVCKTKYELMH